MAQLADDNEFAAALDRYLHALDRCWTSLENAAGEPSPGRDQLYFHFSHLMNNRVGIPPPEEAYLASLLLTLVPGEDLNRPRAA